MNAFRKLAVGVGSFVFVVALAGCASVIPMDLDGSKADGVVMVGAKVGIFDTIDWEGAEAIAVERCAAWGYSDARAFSGMRERCLDSDCFEKEITRTYQCVD